MVFKRMKKFLKRNWRGIAVAVLALSFFAGTAGFNYAIHDPGFVKFTSPDGTANYVFSKVYAQTGEMTIFEKYNIYVEDIIHPRSIRSELGVLKPVSFLGIILIFGKIASITSYKLLPYLTPLFAAAAIIFFYLLVKGLFGKRNALLSSVLLASFPPFIYYTARGMFHNVLFVSLLIIGLYFAYIMASKDKFKPRSLSLKLSHVNWKAWLAAVLAGGLIGLAISVRMSELLWLLPVLSILWLFNIRKIGVTKLVLFLSFLFVSLLPTFYWNQVLHGNPLYGGYPEMNRSISSLQNAGGEVVQTTIQGRLEMIPEVAGKIKDTVFYFGFNPELAYKMFYYYCVEMFPWLFWLGLLGAFIFFQGWGRWKRKHWAYIAAFLVASLVLIYYYGSWKFHDNPNEASHTIGNSYTRYWLPVYLGALPFVSIFIGKIPHYLFPKEKFKKKVVKTKKRRKREGVEISLNFKRSLDIPRRRLLMAGVSALLVLGIAGSGINFVLTGPEEGLLKIKENHQTNKTQFEKIIDVTESNAVIITRYHDKLLFPQRKVVFGLFQDDNMIRNYSKITEFLPLYYYNFAFPSKSLDYLNNRRLSKFGLNIEEVEEINQDFTLYRLFK